MILGAEIRLKDAFTGTLTNLRGGISETIAGIKTINSMKARPEIRAVDRSGDLVGSTLAKLRILGHMTARPVIRLKDEVSGQIARIKNSLLSLQGLAAMGLGAFGIHKITEATVGAAMDFETQLVSMEHWLKGNKALAREFTSWLDMFAAKTPFEMGDIFPAGARAVNVSDGDIEKAKRLVTIAADMAALTPGKTVEQAMEALADVAVGEYARLQEFGFNWKREMGGFEVFLREAEAKFAGGATKLSQTTRGRISTITDTIKAQFRATGQGILEALSPRLQKITDWFDRNPEKVSAWRNKLVSLGRETFEGILLKSETFLGRLMKKFDDPGFQRLDWGGKITTMLNEVARVTVPAAASVGAQLGSSFASGILEGLITAAAKDPKVGLVLGLMTPGPWQVKAAVAAAMEGIYVAHQSEGVRRTIGESLPGTEYFTNKRVSETASAWRQLEQTPPGQALVQGGEIRAATETTWSKIKKLFTGHASGLSYVPYDNYPALLHRGERVLTRKEAARYKSTERRAPVQQTIVFNINAAHMTPGQIVDAVAEELRRVALNMGMA